MLDVVFTAMFLVLPVLATSIYLVWRRRLYSWHKRLQLTLATVLLVTAAAFEIDMRVNGWRERSAGSAYLGSEGGVNWVFVVLAVHLVFAVSTALLWIVVLARSLASFPNRPGRCIVDHTDCGAGSRRSTWCAPPSRVGCSIGWRLSADASPAPCPRAAPSLRRAGRSITFSVAKQRFDRSGTAA